jgi:hypothetical protein
MRSPGTRVLSIDPEAMTNARKQVYQPIMSTATIATALKIRSLASHARVEALAFIKRDVSSYTRLKQP